MNTYVHAYSEVFKYYLNYQTEIRFIKLTLQNATS